MLVAIFLIDPTALLDYFPDRPLAFLHGLVIRDRSGLASGLFLPLTTRLLLSEDVGWKDTGDGTRVLGVEFGLHDGLATLTHPYECPWQTATYPKRVDISLAGFLGKLGRVLRLLLDL